MVDVPARMVERDGLAVIVPDEPLALALDGASARGALARAVAAGVRGGALYDALIAVTADRHGAQLLTADLRAAPTYRAVGARTAYLPA